MNARRGWLLCAMTGLIGLPTLAQDSKPADKKPEGQAPAGNQAPSEAEAAMMEMFMKLAAPGPHHEQLKPLAGKWETAGRFRMDPQAPWTENKSKCTTEWILGGRFLNQRVTGEPIMPGQPAFEGFGIIGYDNQLQKFVFAWMDNMGTMIMTGEGTGDAAGKVITFKSEFLDPMSNQKTWMKLVYRIENQDKYVLEIYGPDQTGKEFLTMEMVNTRVK